MNAFGPVSEAAHGGQSSPAFDLLVGFVVLGMTWFGFWKRREQNLKAIWISVGISLMCAVFIVEGIRLFLK